MSDRLRNREAKFGVWHSQTILSRQGVVAETGAEHHDYVMSFRTGSFPDHAGCFLQPFVQIAQSFSGD